MRQLLFLILVCMAGKLTAQTKEIAFKSHSGDMKNFRVAMDDKLFGADESNFGLPPNVTSYSLDSVIYLSENKVLLVKTVYKREYGEPKDSDRVVRTQRDTISSQPLFFQRHALDSIRRELKKTSECINPVNKIIFVGYDNKRGKKKNSAMEPEKKENSPVFLLPSGDITDRTGNDSSPSDNNPFFIIALILTISSFGGWVSWKLYKPRVQIA